MVISETMVTNTIATHIAFESKQFDTRVSNVRSVYKVLPQVNWFKSNWYDTFSWIVTESFSLVLLYTWGIENMTFMGHILVSIVFKCLPLEIIDINRETYRPVYTFSISAFINTNALLLWVFMCSLQWHVSYKLPTKLESTCTVQISSMWAVNRVFKIQIMVPIFPEM